MTAKLETDTGTVRMRPRARLLNLIGEDLISDEPVAVVELVKNAYDADATWVRVAFEDDPDNPSRLVIEDNGHGMSLETVLSAWLEPGTDFKTKTSASPGGRTYQGAKGIGRFAAARLARDLLLESRVKDGTEVTVLLEWDQFDEEQYLDEIDVSYEMSRATEADTGTTLSMERVRRTWSGEDYKKLHARLTRLISPFQDVQDFEIYLEIPGHDELSGLVEPPEWVLRPMYMLRGTVDSQGKFRGELIADGKTNPHVNGETVNKPIEVHIGEEGQVPGCGELEVELRAWDRDRESLEPYFVKDLGMTLHDVRSTLDAYSGVSIYRDGFRVYPYGEPGDDWLKLDSRSRQNPTTRLANNQVIGAIKISRQRNPELRDRSNREGMVRNDAHGELERCFVEILAKLESFRYDFRPRKETPESSSQLFEGFDLSDIEKVVEDADVKRRIRARQGQLQRGIERIQDTFSRMLRSAGLGQMVDIVVHEIGTPLGKLRRQTPIITRTVDKHADEPAASNIKAEVDKLDGWIAQIATLRNRLEPQTPAKRGRATAFDIREEIEDTLELYDALLKKQKVELKLDFPDEEVRVRMSRASLTQVLANLIDNAIFWMTRQHGSGKGGKLSIGLSTKGPGFIIGVADDGPGVPPDNRENIFEPYFSTKPSGMGLGLYIARLVIEPYGRLMLADSGKQRGARFEAHFEKSVGR